MSELKINNPSGSSTVFEIEVVNDHHKSFAVREFKTRVLSGAQAFWAWTIVAKEMANSPTGPGTVRENSLFKPGAFKALPNLIILDKDNALVENVPSSDFIDVDQDPGSGGTLD